MNSSVVCTFEDDQCPFVPDFKEPDLFSLVTADEVTAVDTDATLRMGKSPSNLKQSTQLMSQPTVGICEGKAIAMVTERVHPDFKRYYQAKMVARYGPYDH